MTVLLESKPITTRNTSTDCQCVDTEGSDSVNTQCKGVRWRTCGSCFWNASPPFLGFTWENQGMFKFNRCKTLRCVGIFLLCNGSQWIFNNIFYKHATLIRKVTDDFKQMIKYTSKMHKNKQTFINLIYIQFWHILAF